MLQNWLKRLNSSLRSNFLIAKRLCRHRGSSPLCWFILTKITTDWSKPSCQWPVVKGTFGLVFAERCMFSPYKRMWFNKRMMTCGRFVATGYKLSAYPYKRMMTCGRFVATGYKLSAYQARIYLFLATRAAVCCSNPYVLLYRKSSKHANNVGLGRSWAWPADDYRNSNWGKRKW